VLPLQQPFGHEAALQMHAPPLQVCPLAHMPQLLPPVPQAEALCALTATHVPPLQQPVGHEVASQTHAPEALHVWPVEQLLHAAPPIPQVPMLDVWHRPLLSQQPFGQEVALQVHAPPLHV
jgi:hypothetical protein